MNARELGDVARRAEDLGYDALLVPDHLIEQLAPVPAMAVIAAATERLRTGTFVLNNDLRHPAVLAQDLASLDVLSEGRLIVGIGAGWNRPEYEATGIPFEAGGTRVGRLAESVAVLKGLFGDRPFSHAGEHYSVTEMDGQPKPRQRPHPPFLIGGGGRRLLRLAAREAQIVGLAPRVASTGRADVASITWEATAEKIDWVREDAGARFDDIELNVYPSLTPVTVAQDPRRAVQELLDRLGERVPEGFGIDEALASPHLFIGTHESFAEKFTRLRDELGVSTIMTGDVDDLAPVVARLREG
jgi:probable F420-dependent oxidoreductase